MILLILPDHIEDYSKIKKKEALGNYLFPENDLKTSFKVNFSKTLPHFGDLGTNQNHEI